MKVFIFCLLPLAACGHTTTGLDLSQADDASALPSGYEPGNTDLEAIQLRWEGDGWEFQAGEPITITFTIANPSEIDLPSFNVELWLTWNAEIVRDEDVLFYTWEISDGLPGGYQDRFSIERVIDANIPVGEYWMVGWVDSDKNYTEWDEGNNTAYDPLILGVL